MEFDDQLKLGHLLLNDESVKFIGEEKFNRRVYRSRKGRGATASSYSYECKVCTIKELLKQGRKSAIY